MARERLEKKLHESYCLFYLFGGLVVWWVDGLVV